MLVILYEYGTVPYEQAMSDDLAIEDGGDNEAATKTLRAVALAETTTTRLA